MDRLELGDTLFCCIMDRKLYYAPVGELDNVLDVGTGTGSWAIAFGNYTITQNTTTQLMFYLADEYPNAAVLGLDINYFLPKW